MCCVSLSAEGQGRRCAGCALMLSVGVGGLVGWAFPPSLHGTRLFVAASSRLCRCPATCDITPSAASWGWWCRPLPWGCSGCSQEGEGTLQLHASAAVLRAQQGAWWAMNRHVLPAGHRTALTQ
jgi:hypothetical protein